MMKVKNKFKKSIALLTVCAVCILAVFAFAGCSGDTQNEEAPPPSKNAVTTEATTPSATDTTTPATSEITTSSGAETAATAVEPSARDNDPYKEYVKLADYIKLDLKGYAVNADAEYDGIAIGALVNASTFTGYSPEALARVETVLGIFMDDSETNEEQKAALTKRTHQLMAIETLAERENIQVTDAEYKTVLTARANATAGDQSEEEYETAFGRDAIMQDALQKKVEEFLVLQIAKNQGIEVTDTEYKARLAKLYDEYGSDDYKTAEKYEKAIGEDYVKYHVLAEKIGAVWP